MPDIVAEVAAAFEGYEGAVVSQDVDMLEAGLRRWLSSLLISLASLENMRKTSRPDGRKTNCAIWTAGTMSNSQVL